MDGLMCGEVILRRALVMNLRAASWIRFVERLVAEGVWVKRERALVVAEVRRLDSFNVVVCAGAGFLFELFEVDDEAVWGVALLSRSAGSIELKISALARFSILQIDFVVSLTKERPKSAISVVATL